MTSDETPEPETETTPVLNVLDAQTPDGRRVVVVMLVGERLSASFELSPTRAEVFAEALTNIARVARSGLTIANEVPK